MAYLVLPIDTSLNISFLYEIDNMLFKSIDRPSECLAHTLQLDCCKGFEVKDEGTILDL